MKKHHILILGPETSGKSLLARTLAHAHGNTFTLNARGAAPRDAYIFEECAPSVDTIIVDDIPSLTWMMKFIQSPDIKGYYYGCTDTISVKRKCEQPFKISPVFIFTSYTIRLEEIKADSTLFHRFHIVNLWQGILLGETLEQCNAVFQNRGVAPTPEPLNLTPAPATKDKRFKIASSALQGLVSNPSLFPADLSPHDITRAARLAAQLADATLVALEPQPTPTQKF